MLINEIKADKNERKHIRFPLKLFLNSYFLSLFGRRHAITVITEWNITTMIKSTRYIVLMLDFWTFSMYYSCKLLVAAIAMLLLLMSTYLIPANFILLILIIMKMKNDMIVMFTSNPSI